MALNWKIQDDLSHHCLPYSYLASLAPATNIATTFDLGEIEEKSFSFLLVENPRAF